MGMGGRLDSAPTTGEAAICFTLSHPGPPAHPNVMPSAADERSEEKFEAVHSRHQNARKPWKNRLERLYLGYLSARDSIVFRALSFGIEKTVLHER
jgi:hypothetical protein